VFVTSACSADDDPHLLAARAAALAVDGGVFILFCLLLPAQPSGFARWGQTIGRAFPVVFPRGALLAAMQAGELIVLAVQPMGLASLCVHFVLSRGTSSWLWRRCRTALTCAQCTVCPSSRRSWRASTLAHAVHRVARVARMMRMTTPRMTRPRPARPRSRACSTAHSSRSHRRSLTPTSRWSGWRARAWPRKTLGVRGRCHLRSGVRGSSAWAACSSPGEDRAILVRAPDVVKYTYHVAIGGALNAALTKLLGLGVAETAILPVAARSVRHSNGHLSITASGGYTSMDIFHGFSPQPSPTCSQYSNQRDTEPLCRESNDALRDSNEPFRLTAT
jgi:hypothetical protein